MIGKFLPVWGIRIVYTVGIILAAIVQLLLGSLQWVHDPLSFLIFSFIVKCMEVGEDLYKEFET